ncbi:MAG: aminoacetone oxidase family FAD-binding enzyme [Lachnospiraceae bacterium]|nr:aminoacetone oxidase family FAD-binding enzyme [Lachnospiraceae bacterium]
MSDRTVLVFGGGPAGMAAAIAAAAGGARVILTEKTDRTGRKLSMTGNGRGNLTNRHLLPEAYSSEDPARIAPLALRVTAGQLEAFFVYTGLRTRAEGTAVYPLSGQASGVVTVLDAACRRLGVTLRTGSQLKRIEAEGDGFRCVCSDGEVRGDAVILATGGIAGPASCRATGDAYYICEQLGIACAPRRPALVPLTAGERILPGENGVRARAAVSFYTFPAGAELPEKEGEGDYLTGEYGEVQFAGEVLSGIPVLQASGAVGRALGEGRQVMAYIDLCPEYSAAEWAECRNKLEETADGDPETGALALLSGIAHDAVNRAILQRLGAGDPDRIRMADLDAGARERLWACYRAFPVRITGVCGPDRAQVTAGGVRLTEVDDDLQVRRIPGLYIAGELLDIDGRCGGYNLHWAFASGLMAGTHAATGRRFSGRIGDAQD